MSSGGPKSGRDENDLDHGTVRREMDSAPAGTSPAHTAAMNAPSGRRRELFGNMLLAGAALMLALMVAEVALQYVDARAQARRARRAHPFYTWSFHTYAGHPIGSRRGLLALMQHPLVGTVNLPNQQSEFFRINRLGFRGAEVGPKRPDRRRIVLVGGSAAFGTGLADDGETLAAQVEQRLPDTEVVNAAVIGHRSGQELTLLTSTLVDLEPDLVMTLDGWNDFWALHQKSTPWPDVNGARQVQEELERLHALSYAPLHVRLLHLPDVVLAYTLRRLGASPLAGSRLPAVEGATRRDLDGVAARYARNQVTMARVAAAFGAGFLCVLQPNGSHMRTQRPNRYTRFRELVETILRREGVAWLDLNDRGDLLRPDMFMDPIHLDARGNAAMADVLAPVLAVRASMRPGSASAAPTD